MSLHLHRRCVCRRHALTAGTAHSTSALISARCIQLVIMKYITHASRGYDFVGSVDMTDLEEGELPTTFYRAKWGPERAVWDMIK